MTDLNELNLPKQEDVLGEYDLGGVKATLIEITEENRESLVRLCTAMMLAGEVCRFCGKKFQKRQFKDVIFAGRDEPSYAHGRCWRRHSRNEADQKD